MARVVKPCAPKKRLSSVSRAVDLATGLDGQAGCDCSAGHTGAAVYFLIAIKLRMLLVVERPGIAALVPTERTGLFVLTMLAWRTWMQKA